MDFRTHVKRTKHDRRDGLAEQNDTRRHRLSRSVDGLHRAGPNNDILTLMSSPSDYVGFNYPFNALNPDGKSNEMNAAVRTMFAEPDGGRTRLTILQTVLPLLRLIVRVFYTVLRSLPSG